MNQSINMRRARSVASRRQHGFTLIELIVATAILSILVGMAVPMAKNAVNRERERELRQDLWMMRDAIDRYKDASEKAGKKLKFLRKIPVDPITKQEWGMRSMQDDKDSDSWGGQNVFDVYSKSDKTALDGTKYKDW